MRKKKPSINDLAARLKISKTTVSFIMNGKAKEKRISAELVKKVEEAARKLGYQANPYAKSLRTGRTNLIGLMVEDISNPFFSNIAKSIEEKIYANGYKVVYCSTENDKVRGREFLKMFSALRVDGCIIAPTMGMETDIREMVDRGMNIVLFDRTFRNKSTDAIMVDNKQGLHNAVTHLVQQGFRNIAFITLAFDKPEREERVKGYQSAMAEHGLVSHLHTLPFKVRYHDYTSDIRGILEKTAGLDAVIFGTNYLGISGLEAIKSLKLTIPRDLAVVSFDDHDLFRIHEPGITVVAQPIEEIAQASIETLLKKLQSSGKTKSSTIILKTTLVVRESSSRKC
jgi:LacI family transcriptional regulator